MTEKLGNTETAMCDVFYFYGASLLYRPPSTVVIRRVWFSYSLYSSLFVDSTIYRNNKRQRNINL